MPRESSQLEQAHKTYATVMAQREAERRAFEPAEMPEALILRVIGGWENVLGEVNFTRFDAAGHDAGPLKQEKLAKGMRQVADVARVRWPHQQWAATATKAKFARDELAHMLYVESVTGDRPDRGIHIVRLGAPGGPRKAPDGATPGELSWRDETWSAQTRHVASISETSLMEALRGMRWMLGCCRGLLRIRDLISDETAELPDDKVIDPFIWQVNWWLPEWGDPTTTSLTVSHVRLTPGESN